MNAYVVRDYGPDARFEQTQIPKPVVQPGHLLIQVKATSLNPVDWKIRTLGLPFAPDLPAVLHGDVAGIVTEVGEGVPNFHVGDEVYGCAGGVKGQGGALADYMLVDADLMALKPRTLGFPEAAALPLVSITAWEGLIDRARVQPGQRVLVHAAAGGVGHIAIQLAALHGATVYTTASNPEKGEIGRQLGAKAWANYNEETPEAYTKRLTNGDGFDIVFDTIGGSNIDRAFKAAAHNGQVITIVSHSTHDLSLMHQRGLTLHVVFMLLPMLTGKGRPHHGEILQRLATWVDEGKLRPLIDANHFTLDEINAAHDYFAAGKHTGKIVIEHPN
ncbi:MAG: zinc-dependent alcohol dehydrogenase family protein [Nitrospira sp.]|nr:zinc-dependent alcohol dehydrogenase family protein [Nitrospira sp.]